MTTLTYPDGDYQFVAPAVLKTGDTIRIHYADPHNLSTTSEPVTIISEPAPTKNYINVKTIPDSVEHQMVLFDAVTILRRIPTLPTEQWSYIFLDEYTPMRTTINENTLAQLIRDGDKPFWHFLDTNMQACAIAPDRITKWRHAYVTDKAPNS